jgi:hypothetical protein
MSYAVLQNVITKQTQEQFPDGLITKVGNDSYDLDGAINKWHSQCLALDSDADTLRYKVAVVDSQLNIVGNCVQFKDKGVQPTPEPTEG